METLLTFNAAFKQFSGDSFILSAAVAAFRRDQVVRERTRGMVIQIKEGASIENPRNYEPHEVEQLRHLLTAGSTVQADPRREHFYELEGKGETFYIHLSPISRKIVLVAKWNRQSEECCLGTGHLVA
jgi:hypothetical protein